MKLSQRAQQLIARTESNQTALRAVLIFAAQNPGFEWANYGNLAGYRSDARPVQKQFAKIKDLSWRFKSLDNDSMIEAAQSAFSGRLEIKPFGDGHSVEYTAGQYFPTEYRAAALAVITRALEIVERKFQAATKGGAK